MSLNARSGAVLTVTSLKGPFGAALAIVKTVCNVSTAILLE